MVWTPDDLSIPEDGSIPNFLKVENRAQAAEHKQQKAPGKPPEPSPEEKVIASMSPKAQALAREQLRAGRMRKHWLLEPGRVESLEKQVADHEQRKAERVAFLRTLPKKEKTAKPKFGSGVKIKVLKEAPRAEGTGASLRYAQMVAWVKKNPGGTVEQLLAETKYGKNDYKWDIQHGNITSDIKQEKSK